VSEVTHDEGLSIAGTGRVGSVYASYAKLVHVFGTPNLEGSADNKTRAEWWLDFDGVTATIYDWKRREPLEEVHVWNVGGRSREALTRVNAALAGVDRN